ncbi:MAG TPA: FAD-binding oxidoreductase [Solirubrobacteraceae bacterium]
MACRFVRDVRVAPGRVHARRCEESKRKERSDGAHCHNVPTADLRTELAGALITPSDLGYDGARQVYLEGLDRRPVAVARVADADDVARVIRFARESNLELAVRSGGHSFAGHGTCDGGIVIDLSGMSALAVDAPSRTAWVETGMTAGEYTTITGRHGLATGLGDTGSVGIGGITLAGGIGFLVRSSGLTIDALLAAELVTADGELVRTSESSEADLFWALRGGGGNFGVVTRLQLRLREVSQVVGGMLILPATPAVICGFLEAASAAPEELSTIASVMLAPSAPFIPDAGHGRPILVAQIVYAGPLGRSETVLAPFRALARPYADQLRPMRYADIYEGAEQSPRFASTANFFAHSLRGDGAEAILESLPQSTATMGAVQLRVLGGAVSRMPHDATAFAHRDRGLFVNVAAMYADGGETATHDAWVGGVVAALGGNGAGGYVGFLGDEDHSTIRAAYPGRTWDRLPDVKRRYDPDNLFRLNHNIPPQPARLTTACDRDVA